MAAALRDAKTRYEVLQGSEVLEVVEDEKGKCKGEGAEWVQHA